jgi:hypothetical protein
MGWFRSHRRPSAWLALLALVLQLGLAFGHVHAIAAGRASASAVNASNPSNGDTEDNDYCATCAILALLANAQAASPPAVMPAVAPASVDIVLAPELARANSPSPAFHSRAPPLS